MNRLKIKQGKPYPFGTSTHETETNFALFCPLAQNLSLCLFTLDNTPICKILLDCITNKTGDVWHISVSELPLPILYAYEIDKNTQSLIMDPYAKSTSSSPDWGTTPYKPLARVDPPESFNWENDIPLNIPSEDLIIYEMHVRALTQHASSNVKQPGTFLGMIEKIPHLRALGINAVEFLPIVEFEETECFQRNPETNDYLYNFWGYSSLNFFSLMNRYAAQLEPSGSVNTQFKTLVRELHKNSIEVILDVVFNHTGEGNEKGPIFSFKALANSTYYIHNSKNGYYNYSGCGNTLNCNHPVVIQMIIDCLHYWVVEMHVDGFRFDLASIFMRGEFGEVLTDSPLLKAISQDPILTKTKLIAEPWDAVGLYNLGGFCPTQIRWSEWNGRYRDTVRRFIKGTPGNKADFASALCGSQEIFNQRNPASSVNFVTAHDGFSLADLVAYNHKHNEINGENNQDGSSFNDSWNCGVEGFTEDQEILALRAKQMRNFHVALMISQGIPMLHMGDEYCHTKNGNNNTWCQDNELSWFLWDEIEKNSDFYRFYRLMIAFRKENSELRHAAFLTEDDIDWHGTQVVPPNWQEQDSFLAFTLKGAEKSIFVAFNAQDQKTKVELPLSPQETGWQWVVNTANASPDDFNKHPKDFPVMSSSYEMEPYSAIILISRN
jgi:isoamylase/glycogen operon protein